MTSFENSSFIRLYRRESERFERHIEVVFEGENGFIFFDGVSFEWQKGLFNPENFEDISNQLIPSATYTIERITTEYDEDVLFLTNGQKITIIVMDGPGGIIAQQLLIAPPVKK